MNTYQYCESITSHILICLYDALHSIWFVYTMQRVWRVYRMHHIVYNLCSYVSALAVVTCSVIYSCYWDIMWCQSLHLYPLTVILCQFTLLSQFLSEPSHSVLLYTGSSVGNLSARKKILRLSRKMKHCTRFIWLSLSLSWVLSFRSASGERVWSPAVSEDGKTSPYMEPDSQVTTVFSGFTRAQVTGNYHPTH